MARDQQKINQYFDDFLGFVHSIAKKKHEKVSKSSIVDKNGLGEYEILNFRHFRQSGDLLDTIGPSKSLCYVLKHKLYLKLLRFCAPPPHCTEIDFALSFGAVLVKMIDLSKTESRDFFGIILDQENSQKLHLLPKSLLEIIYFFQFFFFQK